MEKVFFFYKSIPSSCNTVLFRFSQLQALHKHLSTVHKQLYLHGNFPPLLETSFFNRQGFPSKSVTIFSPRKQPEVVEIRRTWILELLEFLARYECCRNVEMMMVSVQPAAPKQPSCLHKLFVRLLRGSTTPPFAEANARAPFLRCCRARTSESRACRPPR